MSIITIHFDNGTSASKVQRTILLMGPTTHDKATNHQSRSTLKELINPGFKSCQLWLQIFFSPPKLQLPSSLLIIFSLVSAMTPNYKSWPCPQVVMGPHPWHQRLVTPQPKPTSAAPLAARLSERLLAAALKPTSCLRAAPAISWSKDLLMSYRLAQIYSLSLVDFVEIDR